MLRMKTSLTVAVVVLGGDAGDGGGDVECLSAFQQMLFSAFLTISQGTKQSYLLHAIV